MATASAAVRRSAGSAAKRLSAIASLRLINASSVSDSPALKPSVSTMVVKSSVASVICSRDCNRSVPPRLVRLPQRSAQADGERRHHR